MHCYVCSATNAESQVFPADASAMRPPRLATPGATLRRIANDPAAADVHRKSAAAQLNTLRLNPEPTAHDSIAVTQMDGRQNVYPDAMHCVEGGIVKCAVLGVKAACGDNKSVAGLPHAANETAKILDDFVTSSRGFSNGIHRLPAVRGFTTVKQFTAVMIRSLLFIILAAMCSIHDLFSPVLQDYTIIVFVLCVMAVRNINARRWTAEVPVRIAGVYRDLTRFWDASVIAVVKGPNSSFKRPKAHLPSHYGDLYLPLGTPIHWSTMYFIEPLHQVLKAAYKHSSRFNPDEQILRRMAVLGHVKKWVDDETRESYDRRRKRDVDIQAYLRGTMPSVPGVNTLHANPVTAAEDAWNKSLVRAITGSGVLPVGHFVNRARIYVRREATLIRNGLCDSTVRAFPKHEQLESADGAERAIYSLYAPRAAVPVAAGGVAVPAVVQADTESTTGRFIVDMWISYDIRGLSTERPNAPVPSAKLKPKELNDAVFAVDLAIGRDLVVQPTVTTAGAAHGREKWLKTVLQRVKPKPALVALDIGFLCQPLWSFPVLGSVQDAKEFFHSQSSKWDAEQWLILSKLF